MVTTSLPLCYSSPTDLLAHLDGEWLPRSTAPRQPYLLPIGHQLTKQWSQACWNTSYIMDSKRKVASSKPTDFHLNVTPPLDVVWTPRRCRLQHRLPDSGGHSGACAALKTNVSILIIGDSVTSQLTLSLASMLGGPPSSLDYGGPHVAHAASSFASTVIPSAALPFAMACSPHHCHRPPPVTSALPTSMAPQLHEAVSTGSHPRCNGPVPTTSCR